MSHHYTVILLYSIQNYKERKKEMKRKITLLVFATVGLFMLTACQEVGMTSKAIEEQVKGLSMTIRTYDENSQVIDTVIGKSLMIDRDTRFDSIDSEGTSQNDSGVVDITIGKKEMIHVGSSMIVQEEGLKDVFNEYAKTVTLTNEETRGLPFMNKLMNWYKDAFEGKQRVILIRSQNGTPLATYAGDKVTPYSTDIPKSTALFIDGKLLLVYRCDYTIYDKALLNNK